MLEIDFKNKIIYIANSIEAGEMVNIIKKHLLEDFEIIPVCDINVEFEDINDESEDEEGDSFSNYFNQ